LIEKTARVRDDESARDRCCTIARQYYFLSCRDQVAARASRFVAEDLARINALGRAPDRAFRSSFFFIFFFKDLETNN